MQRNIENYQYILKIIFKNYEIILIIIKGKQNKLINRLIRDYFKSIDFNIYNKIKIKIFVVNIIMEVQIDEMINKIVFKLFIF